MHDRTSESSTIRKENKQLVKFSDSLILNNKKKSIFKI